MSLASAMSSIGNRTSGDAPAAASSGEAGGDRRADGHIARVIVGAVAEILEHVLPLGERCLADPVGALAAHLGVAERLSLHPLCHVVAADAGIGAAAFRHAGRSVVRAARAEIGNTLGDIDGFRERALRRFQPRDVGRQFVVGAVSQQPLADADRDLVRIERALDRKQPIAALVFLADADRLIGGAVKLLAHLHLDERALFLDHDDHVEALSELLQGLLAERPGTADLEQPDAEIVGAHLVDAEIVEGLPHVEIALAGGDDAHDAIARQRMAAAREVHRHAGDETLDRDLAVLGGSTAVFARLGRLAACARDRHDVGAATCGGALLLEARVDGRHDLARADDQGFVYIVDRKKDMVISGGFNVYPSEVEAVLYQHEAVADACVFAVPDDKWGEAVKAFVVLKAGATGDVKELQAHVKDSRGAPWSPKTIDFVEAIAVTGLGKIDRKALRAPYWEGRARGVA